MTKYEEVYFLSRLLSLADNENNIDLNEDKIWSDLKLTDKTQILEEYLIELNEKDYIYFEVIGDDGFKPIYICSINTRTVEYLKLLLSEIERSELKNIQNINSLENRITEILNFNPKKLSTEIKLINDGILKAKEQIKSNPILSTLSEPVNTIEMHFKSISKVANSYEDVYKNIILPIKEEGRNGVKQTVKWAVISIVFSSIVSGILGYLLNNI